MSKPTKRALMSDRERILIHAINLLGMDAGMGAIGQKDAFLRYGEDPMAGDLILCMTSNCQPWKIAWMVENQGNGNALLREVGGPGLCNFGNERYLKLDYKRTVFADQFAEGKEYEVVRKIRAAVRHIDN